MARLGWRIAMLASSLLISGCGDDEDTGDTRLVDHAEYGVWSAGYQPVPDDAQPLPAEWTPSPERDAKD